MKESGNLIILNQYILILFVLYECFNLSYEAKSDMYQYILKKRRYVPVQYALIFSFILFFNLIYLFGHYYNKKFVLKKIISNFFIFIKHLIYLVYIIN